MFRRAIQFFLIVLTCSICSVTTVAQQEDLAALRRQADQLFQAGKFAEAVPLAQRALALAESQFGTEHLAVADALNGLALVYKARGQYVEAEPLYKRNVAIVEKMRGASHPDLGAPLNNLAQLYRAVGRFAEAEQFLKRALASVEALGREHVNVSYPVNNLALLYEETGREAEAEALFKRSLAIREKNLSPEHPAIAVVLNNLGGLYSKQRRFTEAEALQKRALAIREKSLGAEHPLVGQSVANLGMVYSNQNRDAESEPLYRRGHAILEKTLGPNHPEVIMSFGNQAEFLRRRGRTAEAEPLMRRYLENAQRTLGPNHPVVASALHDMALLSVDMGKRDAAEALLKQSLAARERIFGPDHLALTKVLSNLGELHYFQGRWQTALDFLTRGQNIAVRRLRQGQQGGTETQADRVAAETRPNFNFAAVARAHFRLAEQTPARSLQHVQEAYVVAQRAKGSETAMSLAQMSARQARGNSRLALIVRERQDLIAEYQARDKLLIAAASLPANQRHQQSEQEQRSRLSAIDGRLGEIDSLLAKDFPEYRELTNPEPLTIAETQAQLRPDEAVVVFLDAPAMGPVKEESFVWAVTKTDARWRRLERGPRWLAASVEALRCGLDPAAWSDDGQRCTALLKNAGAEPAGKQPKFDLNRAHELYALLFGGFADLIKDKHLLLVPSSALAALPLHVLLTEPPSMPASDVSAFASAPWLVKQHALTVLPSVSGLKLLRQFAKTSKATQPFIGFGNPLLLGPDGDDRRAWDRQACSTPTGSLQVASRSIRSAIPKFFRGGLANVEEIRAQYPLPETADELCAVAKSVGAGESAIYLGDRAREATIKALSQSGALGQARIVHFATHGLLAGETVILAASKAEPALMLTPPELAQDGDDGLLTASEIAQLKLDADWVVLSACNTAAGQSDKPDAEALSGLARSFFYAGARAMLVSHWAVNSEATVRLITKAFEELKADPKIGRAEALRRSMVALIDSGAADPNLWAPFVVVGEGARPN